MKPPSMIMKFAGKGRVSLDCFQNWVVTKVVLGNDKVVEDY